MIARWIEENAFFMMTAGLAGFMSWYALTAGVLRLLPKATPTVAIAAAPPAPADTGIPFATVIPPQPPTYGPPIAVLTPATELPLTATPSSSSAGRPAPRVPAKAAAPRIAKPAKAAPSTPTEEAAKRELATVTNEPREEGARRVLGELLSPP